MQRLFRPQKIVESILLFLLVLFVIQLQMGPEVHQAVIDSVKYGALQMMSNGHLKMAPGRNTVFYLERLSLR